MSLCPNRQRREIQLESKLIIFLEAPSDCRVWFFSSSKNKTSSLGAAGGPVLLFADVKLE